MVYTLEPMLYGNLISQRRSGTTSFYLFDGLDSTTQLTSSTGSVTDSYLYDSFGDILLTGTTTNWFRYVGQLGYYYDTDLAGCFLRARYYSSTIGRLLSRDPVDVPGTSNWYTYVENNPVRSNDPSGLQARMTPPPKSPPTRKPPRTPSGGDFPMMGPPVVPTRPQPPRPSPPPPDWPGTTSIWAYPFWGYGWYCGYYRMGPPKNLPPYNPPLGPIDPLDQACQGHDKCLATAALFFDPKRQCVCNLILCSNAQNAFASGCGQAYPTSDPYDIYRYLTCIQAAKDVMRLYCGMFGIPNPPIGKPKVPFPLPYPEPWS